MESWRDYDARFLHAKVEVPAGASNSKGDANSAFPTLMMGLLE